ncbi:LolA family protein [Thermohalobacter berrensis]|uniref:Outer membrane lipoprotein carrier protein LolA n=1 Tax=Thermohalobacter berrensis TaxID=99594 RepID=A0A419SY35_9FIRM|nr:outer-membrane lipoprotein carrier protein LolA [Thermohalobacter berrensis]RKD30069.1 hypothetical protein BET03_05025 [Thermohalobacter berrensis]
MKHLYLIIIILSLIFITGCKEPTNEEIFYEVQKTYNVLETYSCTATVKIKGEDIRIYKAKHKFKRPNKYVIEIIEPEESKGHITICNGKQVWFYHPKIEKSILIRDLKASPKENMFIGYFLKNLFTNEYISLESEKIGDSEYLIITTEMPGNSKYGKFEKLWVNKKNFNPFKLVILNENKEITTEVIYTDYKSNIKLPDKVFNIESY